jgi:hypothetical protein
MIASAPIPGSKIPPAALVWFNKRFTRYQVSFGIKGVHFERSEMPALLERSSMQRNAAINIDIGGFFLHE